MRPSKRDEILEKATAIFYRNGFQASGMDRLVAETGISKTSIYKHFKTKEDLILATLALRDEAILGKLFRRMAELGETPKAQLIALFDALDEWFHEPDFHGCMFAKACSEYQDPAHPIHVRAKEHVRKLADHIHQLADSAHLHDPENLARQLAVLKEGAVALATLGDKGCAAQDAKRVALKLVAASGAA